MDFGIYAGDTSKTIYVWLADSTTGLASTGQVWNVGSPIFSYNLPLAARSPITPATQTVTGAWSSGGFVEVDGTNEKGVYRLDLPNAAIASGAFTVITLQFTGVKTCAVVIPLHTRKVNAIEWLGGAIPTPTITGVPEVDITHLLGTAWLTPGVAGTPDVNSKQFGGAPVTATTSVSFPSACTVATTLGAVGSVTGSVNSVVGAVGSVTAVSAGAITAASFGASAIDAAALAPDAGTEIGAAVLTALGTGSWATTLATQASVDGIATDVGKIPRKATALAAGAAATHTITAGQAIEVTIT